MRDSAMPDSAMPDSAIPDSAMRDSAMPDSTMLDSAMLDSAMPDSGTTDDGWMTVSGRGMTTCALRRGGTAWCWGDNTDGQIGDGTTTTRNRPTQVGVATTWTGIVTANLNTCAVASDGSGWCWGDNSYGQVGNGTVGGTSATPTKVTSSTPWRAIAVGTSGFACGTKTDGSLWCWGYNHNGAIGDGTVTSRSVPKQVGTDHDWATVSTGYLHTCALKNDSSLWCWGHNGYGELGDGTTVGRLLPERIGTDTWLSVTASRFFTCGVKTSGTLWCWGDNQYETLGDHTTTNRTVPLQYGTSAGWVYVTAGDFEGIAARSDGSAEAWGYHIQWYPLPVPPVAFAIGNGPGAIPSLEYTIELATNHSLYGWGQDAMGQLGNGEPITSAYVIEFDWPTRIPPP